LALVGEVFRLVPVADQVAQHRNQAALVPIHQLLEGRRAPFADLQHQADVRVAERLSSGRGLAGEQGRFRR